MSFDILQGDAQTVLRALPKACVEPNLEVLLSHMSPL